MVLLAGDAAEVIENLVLQDADEPGLLGRLPPETFTRLNRPQQSLLDEVFGDSAIPHPRQRVAEQRVSMIINPVFRIHFVRILVLIRRC